jgi:hypothetical protein
MKYVSIRIPDCGPLGDTFFEANARAMVGALFVNNPSGGWVESVCTDFTHFLRFDAFMVQPLIPAIHEPLLLVQYLESSRLFAFARTEP